MAALEAVMGQLYLTGTRRTVGQAPHCPREQFTLA